MDTTRQDADAMLEDAGGIESAVRARTPREHPLYVATGLVFPLAGLVLDLGRDESTGAAVAVTVAGVLLLAVMAFTHIPYWRRFRQVRKRRTPKSLEWVLAAWGATALFGLGFLLDGTIGLAYTLGGLVGALPSLLWAERLRRTG